MRGQSTDDGVWLGSYGSAEAQPLTPPPGEDFQEEETNDSKPRGSHQWVC